MKKQFSLVGVDGNAFSVMGYVCKAMKSVGFNQDQVDVYKASAMNGTYYDLLNVSMEYIEKCNKRLSKGLAKGEARDMAVSAKTKKRNQEVLDKYFDELYDKYVPARGKASTVGGEIVRAFCRINYRWFNDGDYAGYGYGLETAGPACTYLMQNEEFEEAVLKLLNIVDNDSAYEKALLRLGNAIANYLDANPAVFEEENDEDYQDYDEWYGDEDEAEERQHYYDEEEDDEDSWGETGFWDDDEESWDF